MTARLALLPGINRPDQTNPHAFGVLQLAIIIALLFLAVFWLITFVSKRRTKPGRATEWNAKANRRIATDLANKEVVERHKKKKK